MASAVLPKTHSQSAMRLIGMVVTLTGLMPGAVTSQPGPWEKLTRVSIPQGDDWFEVEICLDVPITLSPRCGWKAHLQTTMPIIDLEVFPSTTELSVLGDRYDPNASLLHGQGTGQGNEQQKDKANANGQNAAGSGQGPPTTPMPQKTVESNLVIGSADFFLLTSKSNDTCITLLALKDELSGLDLWASIHCVCLLVRM